MPHVVEFVCQRCGARSEIRAAFRPTPLQPCTECEGMRQAIRAVSARDRRRRVVGQSDGKAPKPGLTAKTERDTVS